MYRQSENWKLAYYEIKIIKIWNFLKKENFELERRIKTTRHKKKKRNAIGIEIQIS